MKKRNLLYNLGLLALVVALAVLPLWLVPESEFAGADGLAEEAIGEIAPDYQPWMEPLFEPPGAETESLLFAVQAAIGAGVIGYAIGWYRGRWEQRRRGNERSL
ncbi:energy-coupling factor ABC transporter substrate-binding protein [Brevibacillus marinus]|uniref:energy-coupling factor ABC transporter substrate-binding protein n=1 Tax=Brevibacillus marinus TaxID=2496837 RepID=UPI000F8171FC|nr:energy-coupling factor ABC transporter substrate-binding protein [Brevibacillus marinus]